MKTTAARVLIAALAASAGGCTSGPSPLPLTDAPPPVPASSTVFAGHAHAFRWVNDAWVADPGTTTTSWSSRSGSATAGRPSRRSTAAIRSTTAAPDPGPDPLSSPSRRRPPRTAAGTSSRRRPRKRNGARERGRGRAVARDRLRPDELLRPVRHDPDPAGPGERARKARGDRHAPQEGEGGREAVHEDGGGGARLRTSEPLTQPLRPFPPSAGASSPPRRRDRGTRSPRAGRGGSSVGRHVEVAVAREVEGDDLLLARLPALQRLVDRRRIACADSGAGMIPSAFEKRTAASNVSSWRAVRAWMSPWATSALTVGAIPW